MKKKIDDDDRYKAVDSSSRREEWFLDYVKNISKRSESSDKKSKDKHRDKEGKEKDKEREKGKDKEREKEKDGKKDRDEKKDKDKDEKKDKYKDDKKDKEEDKERKEEDKERKKEKEREKERQARVEASLKEREKEVQESLASSMRERDKERNNQQKDEAEQNFSVLLVDVIKTADIDWHEAKKLLKKDSRYSSLSSLMEKDQKVKMFEEHIDALKRKGREAFRRMLDDTTELTLTSKWKEVKKLVRDDPRYSKFFSSDRKREREFEDYLQEKLNQAKLDFRELMKENRIITYKSQKLVEESDAHMKDILNTLKKDKRFLVLECIEKERTSMIMSYIADLDYKGPPPPPTATEPTRRK